MPRSIHIRRLASAIACAIAAGTIAVPLASGFVTEHSPSQNRVDLRNAYGPPDPWQYRFLVTDNSASQNQLHPGPSLARPTGYRFITENSASQNRLPSVAASNSVPALPQGFDWTAAAIGAAGVVTLTLLTTAAVLAARRTRGHVASALGWGGILLLSSVLAGQHAKELHDERVAFSPQDPGSPVR